VAPHSKIDLDVADLIAAVGAGNMTAAAAAYNTGGNSVKGSGTVRTLAGFVNSDKYMGAYQAQQFAYHGDDSYGKTHFDAMVAADTTPSATAFATAVIFLTVKPYVFYELYDGLADCINGNMNANYDSVHAWDEGVAFFAGSTAVADTAGENSLYQMIAGLPNGVDINADIMALLETGGDLLAAFTCASDEEQTAIRTIIDDINNKITAAAINLLAASDDADVKAALEAFLMSEVAACTSDLDLAGAEDVPFTLGPEFACLRVLCADITSDTVVCDSETGAVTTPGVSTTIAGYTPDTDVTPHALIDKDILRFQKLLGVAAYGDAWDVYYNGRNSFKSSGMRNLYALSEGASKMNFPESNL